MSTLRPREGWGRGYYNTEPLPVLELLALQQRGRTHRHTSSIIHVLVVELRVLHVYLC